MVRWDDLKADVIELFSEFKRHKIGWIGVSLIGFMVLMGVLAPVFAPRVNVEWSPANERWRANPRSSPPVWVDWITRDDYHRHTVMDWDGEVEPTPWTYFEDATGSFTQEVLFDELGNRTLEVRHDEDVLEDHIVQVQEREGIENINISDFSVEPVEGDAPLDVDISATLEHVGPEGDENRTVPIDIDGVTQEEYELAPGDVESVLYTHRFNLDGLFPVTMGEFTEVVTVGVGADVEVQDFSVDEAAGLSARISAEIINVVDEERTIRFRIESEDEETGERNIVPGSEEEWTLEGGESRQIDYTEEVPAEGGYYFVLGPEQRFLMIAEDEEEGTSSISTAEEEGQKDEKISETQLQQQGELRITSFSAPDQITQGDIGEISVEIVNEIREEQVVSLYMDGELLREEVIAPAGVIRGYQHTFTLDMQSDVVPREIFMDFKGHSDRYRQRYITIERPDGREMLIEDIGRDDRVGEFHDSITVVRRTNIRENIYSQATRHLRREYNITDWPEQQNVHPTEVIFSKANEDWVSPDAEALKGEYNLNIQLEGINVEMEEATATFSGAVYGVMGTDGSRRDIFQGWVWGARYGLAAGGIVALTTILFGTSFGMTSAYYGGWVDEFMQRLNEILMGIPTLPILIIVLRFWNRSIWVFVLIYALLMWRGAAKVIRSRGLQVAKDTYIEAAESLGSGSGRIIATHMIPQILPYAIAQAALLVPVVIMAEAGLHILGLGDPNIVSWGTLLNEANDSGAVYNWRRSWFWILFPGVGMALVGFGFISTGMAIERIINPKMKQR